MWKEEREGGRRGRERKKEGKMGKWGGDWGEDGGREERDQYKNVREKFDLCKSEP